jgi:hypothetical protein
MLYTLFSPPIRATLPVRLILLGPTSSTGNESPTSCHSTIILAVPILLSCLPFLVQFSFQYFMNLTLLQGSIPGTTRKKVLGLERGPLSLLSTIEELLDRKVAAPV